VSSLFVACFVVSGATSLILQVVWVRKLTEVFGSSTLAISTVLATFMAGLAVGSWLGGRLADRLPRIEDARGWRRLLAVPIFYYALCEAFVALAALLIPMLVSHYRPLNAALWAQLGGSPLLLASARFVLTAVVLMIPTTAMGATLPLLSRQVTRSERDFQHLARRLGILYAANTTGAVVGAGAAGFSLLPALGAEATNLLAATIAGTLALAIVVTLAITTRRPARAAVDAVDADEVEGAPEPPPSMADRRLALAAYAISGATAMALEVLWSRALAVVLGSSVYSFTLILVVFLVGISLGSAALAKTAERTRDPFRTLALIFALTGLAITLTHLVIDDLPGAFLAMVTGSALTAGTILARLRRRRLRRRTRRWPRVRCQHGRCDFWLHRRRRRHPALAGHRVGRAPVRAALRRHRSLAVERLSRARVHVASARPGHGRPGGAGPHRNRAALEPQ